MSGLDALGAQWLWLIAALMLAIAEMLLPGIFLIWLGVAAAVTGIATLLLGLTVPLQFALFALAAVAAVYAGRRWFAMHPIASEDPLLNDRAARLVGRTVIVVDAIDRGEGRVRVGDSVWPARGPDAPAGAQMRITGTAGTWLTVESV